MREKRPTLLLNAADVSRLLGMSRCIAAVEAAFRALGSGRAARSELLGLHSKHGGLHVKAAAYQGYFVAKANANFPANPAKHGLPTIQGAILLCDDTTGELLALMDSTEITAQRTGAATAVAARRLARRQSRVLTLCGCGRQGWAQLRALLCVLPLRTVHAFDTDSSAMHRFAEDAARDLGIDVFPAKDLATCVRASDVVVTCTPARKFFLHAADVQPGTFVAAVGADNEHKQEIDPQLFARARVVTDSTAQCARIGDLHHATAARAKTKVHAELGEVIAKKKPGRTSAREITLFDSTGIALEDAAAAALVYERALELKVGTAFRF